MSEIFLLSYKDKERFPSEEIFWTELYDLRRSIKDSPYIDRQMTMDSGPSPIWKNIEFPKIDTNILISNLANENSENVGFKDCLFEHLESDLRQSSSYHSKGNQANLYLSFVHCLFHKAVILKDISVVKFTHKCEFYKEVVITSCINRDTTLLLSNASFKDALVLDGISFRKSTEIFPTDGGFINVDLKEATLTVKNTLFTRDNDFDGIVWPKARNIKADRCTLRQLKVFMENSRNVIQANIFHSLEMDAYRKELELESWSERFEDKLFFKINRWLSNFSLSWFLPLLWIVSASVGFYSLYSYCSFEHLWNVNSLFQFSNILSKGEVFLEHYWLWALHKILMIPLLYLMVVALKRKTKY